jgi:hypothetical protein
MLQFAPKCLSGLYPLRFATETLYALPNVRAASPAQLIPPDLISRVMFHGD